MEAHPKGGGVSTLLRGGASDNYQIKFFNQVFHKMLSVLH